MQFLRLREISFIVPVRPLNLLVQITLYTFDSAQPCKESYRKLPTERSLGPGCRQHNNKSAPLNIHVCVDRHLGRQAMTAAYARNGKPGRRCVLSADFTPGA